MSWEKVGEAGAVALPAAVSVFGGERQNHANAKQAMQAQAFEERMSSTSWQRGVEDMKRAGLNPALAYGQGGASSPGGHVARMEDTMSRGVSSAQQQRQLQSTLQSDEVQRHKIGADAGASVAAAQLASEQAKDMRITRTARLLDMNMRARLQGANAKESAQRTERIGNLMDAEYHNLWADTHLKHLGYDRTEQLLPFEQALMESQNRLTSANARQAAAGVPAAENMGRMAETAYGQYVVPYLNSAESASAILRDIGIGVGSVRGSLFGRGRTTDDVTEGARLPRIGF